LEEIVYIWMIRREQIAQLEERRGKTGAVVEHPSSSARGGNEHTIDVIMLEERETLCLTISITEGCPCGRGSPCLYFSSMSG
jgi:hypothetical protein